MFTLTDSDKNADHYACLSTDEKPYDESIRNGSDAIEMDTSEVFMFDGGIKRWRDLSTGQAVGPAILKVQTSPPASGISVTAKMKQSFAKNSESEKTCVTDHLGKAEIEVSEHGIWEVLSDYSDSVEVEVTGPADYDITANKKVPKIYGVSWDGTSTTKWKRTKDAALFSDPIPYVAGATVYSSPFDDIMPWAGMTKSERVGGTMVAIPKFYYRLTQNSIGGLDIEISDEHVDGFSVSPAHMDRGDGDGERDTVYVSRYYCSASNHKSNTGESPMVNKSRAEFRSSIHSINNRIWQFDFATMFTIWILYLVEFANWDSQSTIGFGCAGSMDTIFGGDPMQTGYTDAMPYHTGTTNSTRDSYSEEHGTQYRNIEGLWDNCFCFVDGCRLSDKGLHIILDENKFDDKNGGIVSGKLINGYPTEFSISNTAGFPMFYPSKDGGSTKTYTCDIMEATYDGTYTCVRFGGVPDPSKNYGLFSLHSLGPDYGDAYDGARLIELP